MFSLGEYYSKDRSQPGQIYLLVTGKQNQFCCIKVQHWKRMCLTLETNVFNAGDECV